MVKIVMVAHPTWLGVWTSISHAKRVLERYADVQVDLLSHDVSVRRPSEQSKLSRACKEADIVIFNVFLPETSTLRMLRQQNRKLRIALLWHSSLLQTAIDGQMPLLERYIHALDTDVLDGLFTTDIGLMYWAALGRHSKVVMSLPNLFDAAGVAKIVQGVETLMPDSNTVHIGLFGSYFAGANVRKNVLTQLAAIRVYAGNVIHKADVLEQSVRNIMLHTKVSSIANVADLDGIVNIIPYSVPDGEDEKMLRYRALCTVTLQVSLTETFCYDVAESLVLGVPVIVSNSVPAFRNLLHRDRYLEQDMAFVVEDPSDPLEIAECIDHAVTAGPAWIRRDPFDAVAMRESIVADYDRLNRTWIHFWWKAAFQKINCNFEEKESDEKEE